MVDLSQAGGYTLIREGCARCQGALQQTLAGVPREAVEKVLRMHDLAPR